MINVNPPSLRNRQISIEEQLIRTFSQTCIVATHGTYLLLLCFIYSFNNLILHLYINMYLSRRSYACFTEVTLLWTGWSSIYVTKCDITK